MKTPAETPNMTFIDVPDTVDSYERQDSQGDQEPDELVYVFLKMTFFRNRVEIFSFFLNYWMPYSDRT